MNDIFSCSVQICQASLEIWDNQCSCFSGKLILVKPTRQRPLKLHCFARCLLTNLLLLHAALQFEWAQNSFSSLDIKKCLRQNFIKLGTFETVSGELGRWAHVCLNSFEMGVRRWNEFRIGCFWVLKPTFPRI
jgi:hypothetical protein